MGLVYRGDRVYLYRSRRSAGRVRVEYWGSGPLAELAAHTLESQRANRQAAREAASALWEARQADLADLDAQLADFSQLVDAAFRDTMEAAGFYLHKRQWRPRRGASTLKPTDERASVTGMPLGHDIAFALKNTLVERFAGNDLDKLVHAHTMIESWRKELAGPFPTPVEEILVDRVVICRFNVYLADLDVEQGLDDLAPAQLVALERRRSGCHRRLLSAVKALEMIRTRVINDARQSSTRDCLFLNARAQRNTTRLATESEQTHCSKRILLN